MTTRRGRSPRTSTFQRQSADAVDPLGSSLQVYRRFAGNAVQPSAGLQRYGLASGSGFLAAAAGERPGGGA